MKFQRNATIFRGQMDAVPFLGVFFLLAMFLVLRSPLVFTPGVRVELPPAAGLPSLANPTVSVAIDRNGQFYFQNQAVSESTLRALLYAEVKKHEGGRVPLALVVLADKAVAHEIVVRLAMLAREVGIQQLIQATRPPPVAVESKSP
jgi:biopolymer transport protein ExbD